LLATLTTPGLLLGVFSACCLETGLGEARVKVYAFQDSNSRSACIARAPLVTPLDA
jgi:hypothetical protein